MQHRDRTIIQKILAEISISQSMMGTVSKEDFLQNEMLKRAVAMTIINVGELIKNVTNETRKQYPEIPWRAAAGMRDLAALKYQTLRMEDVYNTARQDFDELESQLSAIVKNDSQDS